MAYALMAALMGLTGGLVLGLAARLGEFCTFGAIESAYMGHDQHSIRLWGIVLGVACYAFSLWMRQAKLLSLRHYTTAINRFRLPVSSVA